MGVMMKNKTGLGLTLADFFWSGCVVAPLVVTYWRGTWDLLEDWVSHMIIESDQTIMVIHFIHHYQYPGVPCSCQ